MRIAYDAKRLFENSTGLGNYSRTLVRNLSKVTNSELVLFRPKKKCIKAAKYFLTPSLFTVYTKKNKKLFWRSKGIISDLKKQKCTIYHGLSNEIPFGITRSGIKSVVTIHDLVFKKFPETYPLIDRKLYDLKFAYACKNADLVIAISKSTQQDIQAFYQIPQENIEVVYQAVDPLFYSNLNQVPALNTKKYGITQPYILYVGSIAERKNTLKLIEAFNNLKQQQLQLVLIGKGGSYFKACKQLVVDLQLQNQVVFLTDVKETKQLISFYQQALFTVYPSLYEGFGLPIVESLLCKKAVVCANTSSMPEAAGPGGLLCTPTSVEDLTTKISTLLVDSELRDELAQKGYAYAMETFNPKKLSTKLLTLYQSL